jgi:hypothetical protein
MGANYSLVAECVDFATAAHTLAAVRWSLRRNGSVLLARLHPLEAHTRMEV